MKNNVIYALTLSLFAFGFAAAASAQATVFSGSTAIGLKATVQETMAFTIDNAIVSFSIQDPTKATAGDKSVNVTGNYFLKTGRSLSVCAGSTIFNSVGLTGSSSAQVIPNSAISVAANGSETYTSITAVNSNCGGYGGVIIVAPTPIAAGSNAGTAKGSFSVQIAPVTVAPDVYSGNFYIAFQAI